MRDVWTGGRPEEKREQPPGRRLILEDLDLPGRRIETPLEGPVVIGRDASACHVVLTDPSVARQQGRVYGRNGWVMVCNLSRTNITRVDGQPVLEDRALSGGCVLQMGRVRMRVGLA